MFCGLRVFVDSCWFVLVTATVAVAEKVVFGWRLGADNDVRELTDDTKKC